MVQFPLTLAGLGEEEMLLAAVIISGCVLVYTIYSLRHWRETREKEQTKREIAAYVAEGTIRPEDAVQLLSAASDEAEKMIADGVAWGTVSPDKAEKLIRTMRSGSQGGKAAPAPR
jgi:hypothetical protein